MGRHSLRTTSTHLHDLSDPITIITGMFFVLCGCRYKASDVNSELIAFLSKYTVTSEVTELFKLVILDANYTAEQRGRDPAAKEKVL